VLPSFTSKINVHWVLFVLFSGTNALLSYSDISHPVKALIFFAGILLPWILALPKNGAPNPSSRFLFQEFLPAAPGWFWALFVFAAVFSRFYRLGSLFIWPNGDESLQPFFAIGLIEHWDWRFFYTVGQHPPLFIWGTSLFFPMFRSPFWGVWFFPALLSTLFILLGFLTLRKYFSNSLSLIGTGVLAFSLWPFLCGRLCIQGDLIPPFASLCLYLFVLFLKDPMPGRKKFLAFLCGLTAGLSSLTFSSWPFMVLPFFIGFWKKSDFKTRYFGYFLAAFTAGVLPFLFAVFREGYGQHIQGMSMMNGWFTWDQRLAGGFSYITALFWGSLVKDSNYAVLHAGLLNPLLGAAFFMGLLQMFRHRSQSWVKWMGGAFLIGLFPGLISMNVEMFRVIQILPYLLWITAWGLCVLLSEAPVARRIPLFILLLSASMAFDSSSLARSYLKPLQDSQTEADSNLSIESIRIFNILRETSQKLGPGLIFTEFDPVPNDPSLFVTTYGFNAAANPQIPPPAARWAAVVSNLHYYPFLSRLYPDSQWYWVHEGRTKGPEMVLGLIPITDKNRPLLSRWVEAHRYFRRLTWESINVSEDRSYAEAVKVFNEMPPPLAQDRFLEACYWENRAEFYYDFNYQLHYDDQVHALRQAIDKGYPAAHLYYKLGSLWMRKGKFQEAHGAFEAGLRQEPRNSQILQTLDVLQGMEKKSHP